MMIDIGANLTNKRFRDDIDDVLHDAAQAGVEQIIVTGTSVEGSSAALALARQYPDLLKSTAGVHPHYASNWNSEVSKSIIELARHELVVAVGECGLDFNRDLSPRDQQELCFEEQLAIAGELELPVFLHERDAYERFVSLLAPRMDSLSAAVVHCFTGSEQALKHYLDLGCYIGITGWICDERRGQGLRDIVRYIPADRLLIETDSPYLLPRTIKPKPKGGRNEPALLSYVLAELAAVRGVTVEEMAQSSTAAAKTFFNLDS